MSQDNRNLVIFMVIAAVILIGWQFVAARFLPPPPKPARTAASAPASPTAPAGSAAAAPDTRAAVKPAAAVIAETPRIAIRTPALSGSINLKGARLDDLVLLRHRETVKRQSPPVRLLSPSGAPKSYFAAFGWAGDGVVAPNKDTLWTADRTTLTPDTPVTLSWTSPQGLRFQIRYAVDADYMFSVRQSVANPTAAPVTVKTYGLVSRTGIPHEIDTWTNHVGPVGVFGPGANYDITFQNLQGEAPTFWARIWGTSAKAGENYFDHKGGWLGFGDIYWLAALVPDQGTPVHAGFKGAGDVFQADYTTPATAIAPGRQAVRDSRFFAGAKEVAVIDGYQDKGQIENFDKAIDWGWFRIIEKPLFYYLSLLSKLIGNFGLAIIALTITVRGFLFPIAQRQFASMAKMKAVQPKMKAIQERYADDKPRQQQEIMALYKAEGVNPLAGCLPVLLQIPIMYALYKVLILTIEMRHQPFMLWITDLSAPDPLTPINLFGLLPFTPPAVIAIGIIPILLGISMYFQFKLNPAPMDEAQKQVFAIMPWMLMFVMAPFAVGLQLYWITSNVLTILQQRLLYARHPEMLAPVK
ncbi:membrane protein insertase YidC [Sphingomonas sp.]|uniref:membrane protein insertase YidC n=1 Tax=Sphingomonas sp. TaxID=28214 RepID=UPI001D55C706|nr:membrane protein insertase YidC [Sphingomonas sp.]MBX9796675.1 membrane protein insertase YidC [Sphingomonas sp.]